MSGASLEELKSRGGNPVRKGLQAWCQHIWTRRIIEGLSTRCQVLSPLKEKRRILAGEAYTGASVPAKICHASAVFATRLRMI